MYNPQFETIYTYNNSDNIVSSLLYKKVRFNITKSFYDTQQHNSNQSVSYIKSSIENYIHYLNDGIDRINNKDENYIVNNPIWYELNNMFDLYCFLNKCSIIDIIKNIKLEENRSERNFLQHEINCHFIISFCIPADIEIFDFPCKRVNNKTDISAFNKLIPNVVNLQLEEHLGTFIINPNHKNNIHSIIENNEQYNNFFIYKNRNNYNIIEKSKIHMLYNNGCIIGNLLQEFDFDTELSEAEYNLILMNISY